MAICFETTIRSHDDGISQVTKRAKSNQKMSLLCLAHGEAMIGGELCVIIGRDLLKPKPVVLEIRRRRATSLVLDSTGPHLCGMNDLEVL
jgi:hypothetical protein